MKFGPFERGDLQDRARLDEVAECLPAERARVEEAQALLDSAIANTNWRQRDCINLIPSEMTMSPVVRALSIMDPVGRYAEHKAVKALEDRFYRTTTRYSASAFMRMKLGKVLARERSAHIFETAEEARRYLDSGGSG